MVTMIKTLKESKAKLSELVELAHGGEDVLITGRGEIKARLTRAAAPEQELNMSQWATELRELHERCGTGKVTLPSEQLIDSDREERM